MKRGVRRANRHLWIIEPLEAFEALRMRSMFGCVACYLDELLVVVLADGKDPWNGVLFPVERENHPSILKQFGSLSPHPILPKWLYLPESGDRFEDDATRIIDRIRHLDPRFGVIPPNKKKKPKRQRRPGGPD